MTYGKLQYTQGALKVAAFANIMDAEAPNLILPDPTSPTLAPVQLNFKTQTYDFEIGHSTVIGGKHILSYGGNARQNNFDILLAPNAENRTEFGGVLPGGVLRRQVPGGPGGRSRQVREHRQGRLLAARERDVQAHPQPLDPRVLQPGLPRALHHQQLPPARHPEHGVGDQLRSPGAASPTGPAAPGPPPFFLTVNGNGNTNLKQESIEAWEVAYTGTINGKTTVGIALYRNTQDDNINFVNLLEIPTATALDNGFSYYSATDPAKGVTVVNPQPITLSPFIMAALAQVPPQFGGPIKLPKDVFTYLNLGPIRNKGIELSVEHTINRVWSAYANYSFQDTPEVLTPASGQLPYFTAEVGVPAKNRFNLGVNWGGKRFVGSTSLNYSDKAFWNDVLTAPYQGYTDSYTMVNANFGVKWADGKYETIIKGTNLFNQKIQQHVYGDILRMSVSAEVRIFIK